MTVIPPMMHFDPRIQKQKVKSERAEEFLEASDGITQDIYYAFFHNARLGPSLFPYGQDARREAAIRIAKWASRHLFRYQIFSLKNADFLKKLSAPSRAVYLLETFYNCLLLSKFYLPNEDEDNLIRAVLNNRTWVEDGAWEGDRLTYAEIGVSQTYLDGNPNKPCDIHEVHFANAAILHMKDYQGHLLFMGGEGQNPPVVALSAAVEKILAANALADKIMSHEDHNDFTAKDFIEGIITKISLIHRDDPMGLIRADQIMALAHSSLETIIKPVHKQLEGA